MRSRDMQPAGQPFYRYHVIDAAAGLDQAVLETDDFRLPAVRTYLRLGFVPEPRTPGDARRWSKVLRNLARTGEGAAKVPGSSRERSPG